MLLGMSKRKPGQESCLILTSFFLFFMQNKLRWFKLDLTRHISFSTVSMHYHDFMGTILLFKARNIEWPSSEMVDKSMSRSFKMKYPSTRTVIDCTELKVNMLSLLLLKSQTYSNCSVQIHRRLKEMRHIEMPKAAPKKSICHFQNLDIILKWNKQNTLRLP